MFTKYLSIKYNKSKRTTNLNALSYELSLLTIKENTPKEDVCLTPKPIFHILAMPPLVHIFMRYYHNWFFSINLLSRLEISYEHITLDNSSTHAIKVSCQDTLFELYDSLTSMYMLSRYLMKIPQSCLISMHISSF